MASLAHQKASIFKMRFIVLALTLLCSITYASPISPQRHRREADPGNTVSSKAGVDSGRQDTLSAKYECELYDKNGTCIKTFREINGRKGEKPQTIKGILLERRGNSPAKTMIDMVATSNSDQKISATVDVNRKLYEKNGLTIDASGNVNYNSGECPESNVRLDVEKTFSNGYVGGFGQINRASNGKITPNVGVSCGFRFR